MMALVLFSLIFINTVFLGYLKSELSTGGKSFVFVAMSYAVVSSVSCFFFRPTLKASSLSVIGWAIGISGVFCLYNVPELGIFPGDLVISQLIAPFLVLTFFTNREEKSWHASLSLKDSLPTIILFSLAALRLIIKPQQHAWTFFAVLMFFLLTQFCLRKISERSLLPTMLTVGNLVVSICLMMIFFVKGFDSSLVLNAFPYWAVVCSALLVFCLEYLFIRILKELSPISSATIIASGLPISILYEVFVLKRESYFELYGCGIYFIALAFKLAKKPSASRAG